MNDFPHRTNLRFRPAYALASIFMLIFLAGCASGSMAEQVELSGNYPNADLLVTPDWLSERLDNPQLRIIDMRSAGDYASAHIPGAVNVSVGDVTTSVDGIPFEVEVQSVQEVLNRIGLAPEMDVVIYDNLGMMSSGRLFWTLEYVGHSNVRVLHGGWNAWVAGNRETSSDIPEIEESSYSIRVDDSKLISAEQLLDRLDEPRVAIIDARSPQEYTGEVKLADRGGHIPGAVNLVWLDALTGGDTVYTIDDAWQAELQDADIEHFKSAEDLRAMFADLGISPDQQVITYCQTFWRGSHLYFLFRLMGYEDVVGYDSSWVEWGNRDDLPVVTGSQPGEYAP